ncbi:hypothetical protein GCM10027167_66560 [Nocardia heshunensis]
MSGTTGTAIATNTARHPPHSAIRIPIGTPRTSDPLIPMNTIPIARPRCSGVANSAANRLATSTSVAQLPAITTRATIRLPYPGLAAAARSATAKTPSDVNNITRRSTRPTNAAAPSATIANTAENTVVNCPAAAIETPSPPAISGSIPAQMFSATPARNTPTASR